MLFVALVLPIRTQQGSQLLSELCKKDISQHNGILPSYIWEIITGNFLFAAFCMLFSVCCCLMFAVVMLVGIYLSVNIIDKSKELCELVNLLMWTGDKWLFANGDEGHPVFYYGTVPFSKEPPGDSLPVLVIPNKADF